LVDFRQYTKRILGHATRVFGETVKVYPKKGGVYKINAIFDNEYQSVDPETEKVLSVNQPALGINLNDLPVEIKQHDEVEIRGIRFKVIDKQEDGQGGATLMLHKVRQSDQIRDTRAD